MNRSSFVLAAWLSFGLVSGVFRPAVPQAWAEEVEDVSNSLPTISSLWDYSDPAASETRFREAAEAAAAAGDEVGRDCYLTQAARTFGLRRKFDEAHAELDAIERRFAATGVPSADANDAESGNRGAAEAAGMIPAELHVRYELERGRVFNSSGKPDEARPHFLAAFEVGEKAGLDDLAIDAVHMMAIIETGDSALEWFSRGVKLAEQTQDPVARGWLGPLYNNYGWTLFDAEKYAEALEVFESSLAFRQSKEQPKPIRIAHYCIAKTHRVMGNLDEALAINHRLAKEWEDAGEEDGYVLEEIGECLLQQGKADEARPWFAKAHGILSKDGWLQANEADRLSRLAELGGVQP